MRFIIMFFLSFLGLTLQSTFFAHLRFFGVVPDLVLILVVCFSLLKGAAEGAAVGFFSGLLEDILTGRMLGINALSKMLIGYLVGLTEEKVFKENPWVSVAALFVATIFDNLIVFLCYKFFSALPNSGIVAFNRVLWPALVYNVFLAPLVYLRLYSWLTSKPKHY